MKMREKTRSGENSVYVNSGSGGEVHHLTILGLGIRIRVWVKVGVRVRVRVSKLGAGW